MSAYGQKTYLKAVKEVQSELSYFGRTLSRLIHSRLLWKPLEWSEVTIVRFTPMMVGYIVALLFGCIFITFATIFNYYLVSLHVLFLVFIVGYIIGLVVDYIKLLTSR